MGCVAAWRSVATGCVAGWIDGLRALANKEITDEQFAKALTRRRIGAPPLLPRRAPLQLRTVVTGQVPLPRQHARHEGGVSKMLVWV